MLLWVQEVDIVCSPINLATCSTTTRFRPAGDMRLPTYKLAVVHRCGASVGIIVLTHHRLIVCLFGVSVFGKGNSCADGLSVGAKFRVLVQHLLWC